MDNNQFSELLESINTGSEQIEKTLSALERLSKMYKKEDESRKYLINQLEQRTESDTAELMLLIKEFLDLESEKQALILKKLSSLEIAVKKINKRIEELTEKQENMDRFVSTRRIKNSKTEEKI